MPYKDYDKQREANRERMRKVRQGNTEGNTEKNDVLPDSSKDVLPEMFEGKPRYLTLSDGQVYDRAKQPLPTQCPLWVSSLPACNRKLDLSRGMSKQRRLAMIIRELDKDVSGLGNNKVNLQTMVRYGISGMTLDRVLK